MRCWITFSKQTACEHTASHASHPTLPVLYLQIWRMQLAGHQKHGGADNPITDAGGRLEAAPLCSACSGWQPT